MFFTNTIQLLDLWRLVGVVRPCCSNDNREMRRTISLSLTLRITFMEAQIITIIWSLLLNIVLIYVKNCSFADTSHIRIRERERGGGETAHTQTKKGNMIIMTWCIGKSNSCRKWKKWDRKNWVWFTKHCTHAIAARFLHVSDLEKTSSFGRHTLVSEKRMMKSRWPLVLTFSLYFMQENAAAAAAAAVWFLECRCVVTE